MKVKPYSNNDIDFIYQYIKYVCNYEYISKKNILACKNSLYVIINNLNSIPHLVGVIGCRNSKDHFNLAYYPTDKVYIIDFLHIDNNIIGTEISYNLVKECLADKNDSFVLYKPLCPNTLNDFSFLLEKLNFELYDTSDITYIRKPITIPNKI